MIYLYLCNNPECRHEIECLKDPQFCDWCGSIMNIHSVRPIPDLRPIVDKFIEELKGKP